VHNNDKKWLINFISGRMGKVTYNNTTSKTYNLFNGVPQGAILSPLLFNLFTHDIPQDPQNTVKIATYADVFTATSTK
jgi:hypothetical protein